MYRVKTFGTEVQVFHVQKELQSLDGHVNAFFDSHPGAELIGVNDMPVTDEKGATIGMVRVVAYKE